MEAEAVSMLPWRTRGQVQRTLAGQHEPGCVLCSTTAHTGASPPSRQEQSEEISCVSPSIKAAPWTAQE